MKNSYDILVLGAGVSGCGAAIMAARNGLSVALLGDVSKRISKACTTALNPRSVYYLEKLGLKPFFEKYDVQKIRGITTFSYDGTTMTGQYSHDNKYPNYGYCVPRNYLDQALSEQVQAESGVTVINSKIVEVYSGSDYVSVAYEADGDVHTVNAKAAIDAMGRGSLIAKENCYFKTLTDHQRYTFLGQYDNTSFSSEYFTIGTNDEIGPGYYTVFPIDGKGRVMVAFIVTENIWERGVNFDGDYLDYLVHQSEWRLKDDFVRASKVGESMAFGPMAYESSAFTHERILMVGDSTGFYDPLTGEGITIALLTSEWAVDTVAKHVSGIGWKVCTDEYTQNVKQHRDIVGEHCGQLQRLLTFPSAFDRFISSLSENERAANWLACALGNVLPTSQRNTEHLADILKKKERKWHEY